MKITSDDRTERLKLDGEISSVGDIDNLGKAIAAQIKTRVKGGEIARVIGALNITIKAGE